MYKRNPHSAQQIAILLLLTSFRTPLMRKFLCVSLQARHVSIEGSQWKLLQKVHGVSLVKTSFAV